MLPRVTWGLRLIGLAAVGIVTFSATQGSNAQLRVNVVAYALTAIAVAGWALVDNVRGLAALRPTVLPYLLGVVTVASATATNTEAGSALIFLAWAACMSAGSETNLATGWLIAALGVAAAEIGALAFHASALASLGYPLIILVGVLFGLNRRGYRVQAEQAEALLARSEQLRAEQARAATLDERNRIAREIHDILAHSLGALGVQIQAARAVLTDQGDIAHAVELLDQAQRLAADGLTETRRAVLALRSDTPALDQVLEDLSAAHQRRYLASVEVAVTGDAHPLSPDATLAFTRIAQEALVNTAKHAAKQPVRIRLDYTPGCTKLTVANRLAGHDGATSGLTTLDGGYGLSGMRERLLLIGGSLVAGPRDGEWVVTAQVPQ